MKQISALILLFFSFIALLALYTIQHESMLPKKPIEEPSSPAIDISTLPIAKKKEYFIERTLPAIIQVKQQLDEQYAYIYTLSKRDSLTRKEEGKIKYLMKKYHAENIQDLLIRLHTHPISIILAQAALESGWGTSRFYNEANNIFGIWSYNKNEPRISAEETRGTKTIYVKKYSTLEDSVEGYFKMVASGYAYNKFRKARLGEQNPFKLISHLIHYSELRAEYVKRLYYVMRSNRFHQYDTPSFKPLALHQILPDPVKHKHTDRNNQAATTALALQSE